MALREARWNPETATLTITPIAIGNDPRTRSMFRVTNIADPTSWTARGPLAPNTYLRATGPDLHIDAPVRGEAVLLSGPTTRRDR